MESTRVVGRALGAWAEREGRTLVVELLWVREASFVLAFHIIPFHISLSESLWIASTLVGAGRASCEHQHDCSEDKTSREGFLHGNRSTIGCGARQADVFEVIASAQRLPLTMALSRLGGQPVSVQAPPTSRLAIGLRWMGRCNLVPGLSERMALEIVR